jgi:type I restriction enzyme R subunit
MKRLPRCTIVWRKSRCGNPGIKRKTRYVIVDAVGVCERVQTESRPLEKKPTVSFEKLLDAAALGTTEVAAVESLAGRLIRLERRFDAEVEAEVVQTAKGQTLAQISKGMLSAIDPDEIQAAAKAELVGRASSQAEVTYTEPTAKDLKAAAEQLIKAALSPLATNPDLRNLLKKIAKAADQTIDIISRDTLIYAGPAQTSTQNHAEIAKSFREYIEQHQAEITALQILYSRPFKQRLTEPMLKELEKKLRDNHAAWTEDNLWNAFAAANPGKVKGRSQAGRFADLVALVRFALEQQPLLAPFADSVTERFNEWLMDKAKAGVKFGAEQLAWLNLIRDHIATAISIEREDLELSPFNQLGGLGKAHQLFGEQLPKLLDELNTVLAA